MKVVLEGEEDKVTNGVSTEAPVEEYRFVNDKKDAQAALWEKIASKTVPDSPPITKQDLAKPAEPDKPAPLPDRALVAEDLKEFLDVEAPKVDPLLEQTKRLQEALDQISAPPQEELPLEQVLLRKLDSVEQRLAQREAQEAAKAKEEARKQRLETLKQQFTQNLEADKENYPGVVALGRSEVVFNDLLRLVQDGQNISDVEVLSKHEERLKADYERLKAIYEPSQATNQSNPKPTKQPVETKEDNRIDLTDFTNRKDAQAALWDSIRSRQAQ